MRESCTHPPRARAATGLSQNSCEGRVPPLRKQRYDPCAKEVCTALGPRLHCSSFSPFLAADGDAGAMFSATKAAAALARVGSIRASCLRKIRGGTVSFGILIFISGHR